MSFLELSSNWEDVLTLPTEEMSKKVEQNLICLNSRKMQIDGGQEKYWQLDTICELVTRKFSHKCDLDSGKQITSTSSSHIPSKKPRNSWMWS